jgi:hypothetical protein
VKNTPIRACASGSAWWDTWANFTTGIEHDYASALGSKTTYICAEDANVQPTSAGILYNTP